MAKKAAATRSKIKVVDGGNKSELVRQWWTKLGKDTPNKEVVAAIAKETGEEITATLNSLVSNIKGKLFGESSRGKKTATSNGAAPKRMSPEQILQQAANLLASGGLDDYESQLKADVEAAQAKLSDYQRLKNAFSKQSK